MRSNVAEMSAAQIVSVTETSLHVQYMASVACSIATTIRSFSSFLQGSIVYVRCLLSSLSEYVR